MADLMSMTMMAQMREGDVCMLEATICDELSAGVVMARRISRPDVVDTATVTVVGTDWSDELSLIPAPTSHRLRLWLSPFS